MRAERFYWAVLGHQDRILEWTIAWQRKAAIRKAIENVPRSWKGAGWERARKAGWRVIKIRIEAFNE